MLLQMALFHSFFILSSIPLCVNIHTHTHTTPHIFIHASADGRLGCFHALAIVNSAAGHTGVQVPF